MFLNSVLRGYFPGFLLFLRTPFGAKFSDVSGQLAFIGAEGCLRKKHVRDDRCVSFFL